MYFCKKVEISKVAIRFLSRLLERVIVTDKLKSYNKIIKYMRINLLVAKRRFYQIQISSGCTETFITDRKSSEFFAVNVGHYKKKAPEQRLAFADAQAIWLSGSRVDFHLNVLYLNPALISSS